MMFRYLTTVKIFPSRCQRLDRFLSFVENGQASGWKEKEDHRNAFDALRLKANNASYRDLSDANDIAVIDKFIGKVGISTEDGSTSLYHRHK